MIFNKTPYLIFHLNLVSLSKLIYQSNPNANKCTVGRFQFLIIVNFVIVCSQKGMDACNILLFLYWTPAVIIVVITTFLVKNYSKCLDVIIINDLTEQDTGSYMFRVTDGRSGLTYNFETKVNVTALSQKPTVTSPQLTEGQQTTLTCTAPGHCSGSPPEIIWKWRGTGETSSHVVSNTSTETVVSQKYSSTLTFTPSAKHHGIKVACWVSFLSRFTTEETVTLVVTCEYLKEGEALTLTCSADSHPPSLITWMKLHSEEYLQNGTETATLVIPNVTAEHSGQYICTARHLNTTLTASASVTKSCYVMVSNDLSSKCNFVSKIVKEGEALTLTCSADSHPPSLITWMKLHSEEYLQNGTETATLVIPNVKAEHSGQYVCTAQHFNRVLTASANVTVMCEYMRTVLIFIGLFIWTLLLQVQVEPHVCIFHF
uniref:Ig-like domain-containing protein n=1 Tax=Myripristis murdjan TaxID=586833 RepID=A0A668ALG9_9TELE